LTVLSVEDEAIIVAFRRHGLLPLDDCLYALQPTIPHLTRSSLHRCLQRHGVHNDGLQRAASPSVSAAGSGWRISDDLISCSAPCFTAGMQSKLGRRATSSGRNFLPYQEANDAPLLAEKIERLDSFLGKTNDPLGREHRFCYPDESVISYVVFSAPRAFVQFPAYPGPMADSLRAQARLRHRIQIKKRTCSSGTPTCR
jgi:hypothetical protein